MISKEQIIDYFKSMKSEYDFDYSYEDIETCEGILAAYENGLRSEECLTDEIIMSYVEKCVLALNDLNERCDFSFIETEEREMLWDFIQNTAIECGLQNYSEDITGEYRDW